MRHGISKSPSQIGLAPSLEETMATFLLGNYLSIFLAIYLMCIVREANTTLDIKDGHPSLHMGQGSDCPKSEFQASTVIQFICDKSVFGAGACYLLPLFIQVTQVPPI